MIKLSPKEITGTKRIFESFDFLFSKRYTMNPGIKQIWRTDNRIRNNIITVIKKEC